MLTEFSTNPVVFKAVFHQLLRVILISAVKDDFLCHELSHTIEIRLPEDFPFSYQYQGIHPFQYLIGVFGQHQEIVIQPFFGYFPGGLDHGHGVKGLYGCTGTDQSVQKDQ